VTRLRIENATKRFDGTDPITVFEGLDLVVDDGEFVTVMGPSGCGKTTLLNAVAGIVDLDGGTIRFGGEPVAPGAFPFGYVFQEPRLLEWRTVGDNIEFALEAAGVDEAERDRRIRTWLDRVGLADERDSYPRQLSGGQRQRVGLARALAVDPELLLMDEPFSSLDAVTARDARRNLLDLWAETGASVLFVTHNVREAIVLSDRVVFMNGDGELFDSVTIPHDRPREFDDPSLRETEVELTETFFEELE
jgi:NitT/TauT family transport system ATP-binding protein